ncbi:MAG: DUF2569 domain-containing protein [Acidobacteria bacterium]|nr:DUF2569 domain-containing protein [Acidobacteriota bacterium]
MSGRGNAKGIGGWLLLYLVASVPLMSLYAVGLSGLFSDYPLAPTIAIFVIFLVPLWLLALKSPGAPRWNIGMLWMTAGLMTLRSLAVLISPFLAEGPDSAALPTISTFVPGVVAFSCGWAIVWTKYFRQSARVRNTFG